MTFILRFTSSHPGHRATNPGNLGANLDASAEGHRPAEAKRRLTAISSVPANGE